ncbi:hypothetical protein OCA8868_00588 [Octadecabacter ascidiaceicola]|uniref:Uncharacterized protein n=1 Tax=Octadecabacter ascidiaceicola TaxID=1655543 RepID=A0A238JP78_9RHOB|nr:hypothetical protein OCA8868_00588 [Octadecabacter ascidiaceicola]
MFVQNLLKPKEPIADIGADCSICDSGLEADFRRKRA